MAENKDQDQEFAGFENLDETYADPVDDAALDDATLDAEFQDMDDQGLDDVFAEDPVPAETRKKKVNWFNIIVALIAVAGAGGLVVSKLAPQLLNGGAAPVEAPAPALAANTANTPANAEAAAQAALAPVPAPDGVPAPTGGMLDNPDAFAQLAQNATPEPQAAPVDQTDPFAALNKAQPTGTDVPMPAPISTATEEPVLDAAPVAAAPVQADPMPATTTPVMAAADTAQVSALKGQVDTLSSRMDSIETKLDAALANVGQTQSVAAPADDARFEAIQNVLARLESRLNDLSSRPAQVVRDVSDDDRPAPVKKAAKKATPKAKKSDDAWDDAYKASAPASVQPAVATANNGNWTLRGAQPGQAIIGASNGDIRQVSLGDLIPGIGQVTGIAPLNGRWVVQGTQGRISQ